MPVHTGSIHWYESCRIRARWDIPQVEIAGYFRQSSISRKFGSAIQQENDIGWITRTWWNHPHARQSSFRKWHLASAGVPESFACRVKEIFGTSLPLFTVWYDEWDTFRCCYFFKLTQLIIFEYTSVFLHINNPTHPLLSTSSILMHITPTVRSKKTISFFLAIWNWRILSSTRTCTRYFSQWMNLTALMGR